jgi:hypothetical protein
MAATVLNAPQAVEMSVEVVRAFVRLRQILASNRQLAPWVDDLERKMTQSSVTHSKNIGTLFDAVRSLIAVPEKPKHLIGFQTKGSGKNAPPALQSSVAEKLQIPIRLGSFSSESRTPSRRIRTRPAVRITPGVT